MNDSPDNEQSESFLSPIQHTMLVGAVGIVLCIGITYAALFLLTQVILQKD